MGENTTHNKKQKRKRREILIVVLFQFASVLFCSLSLLLGVGDSSAEEFIPISMHAQNEGDYSADNQVYKFQQVSLDLILEVILDRDSLQ